MFFVKKSVRKEIPWIIVVIAAILSFCFLEACREHRSSNTHQFSIREEKLGVSGEEGKAVIYFLTADRKYLVPVTVTYNSSAFGPRIAVEKLVAGIPVDFIESPLPEDVKLRQIFLQKGTAVVDFTKEFKNFSDAHEAQIALNALTLTLTEFDEIDSVKFLVDGEPLTELTGISLKQPLKRPQFLNPVGSPGSGRPVKVYYLNKEKALLVPVTFFLPEDVDLAKVVAEKLVKGPPEGLGLVSPFWPGTQVHQVKVDDQGIATVDFNSKLLEYGGGSSQEIALLESLVFTLTDLPQVEAVQVLIDGKKLPVLPEGSDISEPLRRPEDLNLITF